MPSLIKHNVQTDFLRLRQTFYTKGHCCPICMRDLIAAASEGKRRCRVTPVLEGRFRYSNATGSPAGDHQERA